MLVVHVHVRVRPGQVEEFLAATLTNARDGDAAAAHKLTAHYATWRDAVAEMMAEPRASTRFSAVFPPDDENWASSAP
jgi:(4S)-4-hydroxy-5-phosphonooxypentane-2,3-dione isomerase